MGRSQELSEFKHGTMIGCHLCNKSIRKISLLLWSTASGIITKRKQLGTTATQPQSGRPCKLTDRGQHMLKRLVRRSRQLNAESIAKDLQTLCGLQISTIMRRELVFMAEQLHPSLTSPSAVQSVGCNGVKQSSGD
ncbi:unnamed protein product [Staurois parvus]|uniref:Transposase n=1 Tax=Staurois parvus TaxID=386267 RepID=A0ABN9EQL3_9NEOB|nr:unnamed protein product [Staurois parvus]